MKQKRKTGRKRQNLTAICVTLAMIMSLFVGIPFTPITAHAAESKNIGTDVVYAAGDTIVLPDGGSYFKFDQYSSVVQKSGNSTVNTITNRHGDDYDIETSGDWSSYFGLDGHSNSYREYTSQGLVVIGIKFSGSGTSEDPYIPLLAYGELDAVWEGDGEGTESSPYLINNVNDLKTLAENVKSGRLYSGKYFKLTSDIDCGEGNWEPIGGTNQYRGTFDGDGNTVTYHITDNSQYGSEGLGLFYGIAVSGTVKNLKVSGSIVGTSIYGKNYAGIAGINRGTIINCSSNVNITSPGTFIAGIAGLNKGTINYCAASGSITWNGASGFYANVAGMTGENDNGGTVTNCTSLCDISAVNANGGSYASRVIGVNIGTVQNCYYLSSATITGDYVGTNDATEKTTDELKEIGDAVYNAGYNVYGLALGYMPAPNIKTQPEDIELTYGYTEESVSVEATTEKGLTLSYQWYSNSTNTTEGGTAIIDADNASYVIPVGKDAGTKEYYYCVVTASSMDASITTTSDIAKVTVKKADASVEAAPEAKTLTYTGSAQELVTAGTATGGEMQYAIGTSATTAPTSGWSTSIPTKTNAGTYYVWYKAVGDKNHNDSKPASVKVAIEKAATSITAPTARTLTYTGSAQALVTAGTATGGTMQYALGTKDAATEEYTTTIPTGTEVGTYYVWYFVAVDDGYDYGEPACVKVIIEEAEPQPEPGVETVDIYGDVKDSNDAPLSAVTVQLKRGYTVLKETVTDGEGKYIFKNVKPGEYNIVATDADGIVKTILVTVSNLNKDAGTIKMPAGDVSSKLVVEPSDTSGTMNIAAGIVVGGLDDLADEVAQEGETTEVIMTVKDNSDLTGKTDDELTEEQILTKNAQSQIKDEAKTTGGQQKTLQFMDFSIIKVVSGNDIPGYISDTVRLLTMVIPFDTTGKYQLGLYRYHEGEEGEPTGVQTITTAPNAYGEKIEIGPEAVTAHVRFFSNYAIGYTTKQEIVDPVNPRRRGGGGGGASSGAVTTTATEVKIITFDANGGEGNMNSQLISGSELKLNGCTFTRDGYIFIGWNTKPDGSGTTYKDGESAKLTDSVKLYALWRMTEEEKYAAMMDLNSKLSVTATEKGFKVTWGKVKDASKYVIYAAYCGKGNTCKKVEELKGTKHNYSLTGLDGAAVDTSKDLKLYVVVYRTVNGKQVKTAKSLAVHVAGKTSDETNAKKVTADKDNISLSVGKTASLTAKITLADKKKKSLKHTAELRYRSSDKSVVTADKEGKLTAKGAGTAYVYIYAQNGVSAKVEVTVS